MYILYQQTAPNMILKPYIVTQNNVKQIVKEEKIVMKGARALSKEAVILLRLNQLGKGYRLI
jgi:hypothetical protein